MSCIERSPDAWETTYGTLARFASSMLRRLDDRIRDEEDLFVRKS